MAKRAILTLEFMPSLGGIERLIHERAKNHEPEDVTVITSETPGAQAFDREQTYAVVRTGNCFPRVPPLHRLCQTLGPIAAFLRLHRRSPFHVIECGQAFPFSLFAYLARKFRNIPFIVWVHGNDLLAVARIPLVGYLLRKSLCSASRIIANSSFVADLVEAQGVDRSKIKIMPGAVDHNHFHPAAASPELRARYGLDGKSVLLTIGRLVERKGIETVISCLPDLIGKYPEVVYLIVGVGPLEEKLRQLVRDLNLEKHVVFAGAVSEEELPSHYHLADIFVMVSRYLKKKSSVEGLGLVYLEAGASGIPIIAGHSGGVPDAVRNNENGLLVDPELPAEICAAIDRLLGDPDLASSLGRNGRAFATRPVDWSILQIQHS